MFQKLKAFVTFKLLFGLTTGLSPLPAVPVGGQEPSTRSISQLIERLEDQRLKLDADGKVVAIDFSEFAGVSSFGELSVFDQLESIDVQYSGQIQNHSLSGIGLLKKLTSLKLRYADEISSDALVVLQYVPNLEELLLTNASQVTDLGPLSNCPRLKRLTLEFTDIDWSLLTKNKLASRMSIEELTIAGDSKLKEADFEVLAMFPKLGKVTFSENTTLTDKHLEKLAQSSSLRSIVIEKCNQVTGSFLGAYDGRALDELKINSTGFKLESLNEFKNNAELVRLKLKTGFVGRKLKSETPGQSPYPWVSQLANLEELEVDSRQFAIEELVSLANSKRLRQLNVVLPRNSTIAANSSGWISSWSSLEALRLSGGKSIPKEWTTALIGNPKLKELILEKCEFKDDSLQSIFEARGLQRLGIISCSLNDEHLSHLPQLTELETLDLLNNGALSDAAIESISGCKKLKHLRISAAREVTGSGFKTFPSDAALETLILLRLNAFTPQSLQIVLQLPNLKEFSFFSDKITKEHFETLKYAGDLETVLMEPQEKLDEIFRWQLNELRSDLGTGNRTVEWANRFRLLRTDEVGD